MNKPITDFVKLDWLYEIAKIRFFEELVSKIYSDQVIRCPVHLAIGHEASAVGVCSNLINSDRVLSYHRSHHHFLARGGAPESLLHELLGSEKGCSGGNGGSTHLHSSSVGFLGSSAIISGILPVATGVAHGIKLKQENSIVVCFCGDASIEEGVFFECLNIAKLWSLPILFVIEDNDLSCYTDKITRQANIGLSAIASSYSIPYQDADGGNIEDVFFKSEKLIYNMRSNNDPSILHVNVYRAHEHCGPDKDNHLSYRFTENEWDNRDPLMNLKQKINSIESEKKIEQAKLETKNLFKKILDELNYAVNL